MILAESGQSVTHLRGKKQCQAKLPAAASGFSLKPTGQTSVLSPFWEFSHRLLGSVHFILILQVRKQRHGVKESYLAQNSLELKLPSGSSPPFYAKQRTLSPEGKKWTLRLISPAPSRSSLWLSSRIPCPSHLRDNYSEQPWRRTGTLRL